MNFISQSQFDLPRNTIFFEIFHFLIEYRHNPKELLTQIHRIPSIFDAIINVDKSHSFINLRKNAMSYAVSLLSHLTQRNQFGRIVNKTCSKLEFVIKAKQSKKDETQ